MSPQNCINNSDTFYYVCETFVGTKQKDSGCEQNIFCLFWDKICKDKMVGIGFLIKCAAPVLCIRLQIMEMWKEESFAL